MYYTGHIKIQANEKQARRHRWMLSMFYKTVATVAKVVQLIFEIQRSILGNNRPATGQEYTGFD